MQLRFYLRIILICQILLLKENAIVLHYRRRRRNVISKFNDVARILNLDVLFFKSQSTLKDEEPYIDQADTNIVISK